MTKVAFDFFPTPVKLEETARPYTPIAHRMTNRTPLTARVVRKLFRAFRPMHWPLYSFYLDVLHSLYGIEVINHMLVRSVFPLHVLRKFGAAIGDGTTVYPGIFIHAADGDYSNLRVGRNCFLMRGCFLDLTAPLEIEDEAIVGINTMLLAHRDTGYSAIKDLGYPPIIGGIRMCRGAITFANAVVLHGVTVGECAMVGAGSVVHRSVPPYGIVAGNPARVIGWVNHRATAAIAYHTDVDDTQNPDSSPQLPMEVT